MGLTNGSLFRSDAIGVLVRMVCEWCLRLGAAASAVGEPVAG